MTGSLNFWINWLIIFLENLRQRKVRVWFVYIFEQSVNSPQNKPILGFFSIAFTT